MGDLRGCSASHEAVVNNVALVRPSRDLIGYELLRKNGRMLKRDFIFRAGRTDIISKDIGYLSLSFDFTTYIFVRDIASTFTCYPKGRDFLSGRFGWLSNRIKRLRLALTETEHILERLSVSLPAITRNWVLLT